MGNEEGGGGHFPNMAVDIQINSENTPIPPQPAVTLLVPKFPKISGIKLKPGFVLISANEKPPSEWRRRQNERIDPNAPRRTRNSKH